MFWTLVEMSRRFENMSHPSPGETTCKLTGIRSGATPKLLGCER